MEVRVEEATMPEVVTKRRRRDIVYELSTHLMPVASLQVALWDAGLGQVYGIQGRAMWRGVARENSNKNSFRHRRSPRRLSQPQLGRRFITDRHLRVRLPSSSCLLRLSWIPLGNIFLEEPYTDRYQYSTSRALMCRLL